MGSSGAILCWKPFNKIPLRRLFLSGFEMLNLQDCELLDFWFVGVTDTFVVSEWCFMAVALLSCFSICSSLALSIKYHKSNCVDSRI